MAQDKRYHVRYGSGAVVSVENTVSDTGILEDLSISGCRVSFTAVPEIAMSRQCLITVYPERDSEIPSFSLECTLAWKRSISGGLVAGFSILKSPDIKSFQRYVDFLAWYSAFRRKID